MQNWQPLRRDKESEKAYAANNAIYRTYDEIWINDIYMVYVRRHEKFGDDFPHLMTWLSIKRHDKEPCNDWRHFQWIKNQLVGEEMEGAQLYPAESRMVDGSNQYHIWCFEQPAPDTAFPFGFMEGRQISEHPFPNGKQRAWPKNMRPADMDEQHRLFKEQQKQYLETQKKINNE